MNSFRDWLNTLFGSDGGRAVQMLFALLLVVLLILAVTWLFRRLFGATLHRGRSTRLSVIDSTVIDQNRRLILLRRDDVEHLVMIGGPNDVLVESRIHKAAPVLAGRAAAQVAARPQVVPVAEPEPPIPAPTGEATMSTGPAIRTRAAAGAASLAAAVASAGSLLRSRIGRPAETEDAAPRATAAAPASERRTLDDAFDAPLGRPAEPVAAVSVEPPTRAAAPFPPIPEPPTRPLEPARIETVRIEPVRAAPLAAEPRRSPLRDDDRFADGLARALAEPTPAPEPAPHAPEPVTRAPEIDLDADLLAIGSELTRPSPVETAVVAPMAPVEIEPLAPLAEEPAPPVRPEPRMAPPEPVVEPVAEETPFDFDFDFDRRPAPEPEPDLLPTVEHAPAPIDEPVIAEEPAIEIFRTPEPPPPPPGPTPPATPAPAAAPTHAATSVDELEEEMARLLAELSGPTRR